MGYIHPIQIHHKQCLELRESNDGLLILFLIGKLQITMPHELGNKVLKKDMAPMLLDASITFFPNQACLWGSYFL